MIDKKGVWLWCIFFSINGATLFWNYVYSLPKYDAFVIDLMPILAVPSVTLLIEREIKKPTRVAVALIGFVICQSEYFERLLNFLAWGYFGFAP